MCDSVCTMCTSNGSYYIIAGVDPIIAFSGFQFYEFYAWYQFGITRTVEWQHQNKSRSRFFPLKIVCLAFKTVVKANKNLSRNKFISVKQEYKKESRAPLVRCQFMQRNTQQNVL